VENDVFFRPHSEFILAESVDLAFQGKVHGLA